MLCNAHDDMSNFSIRSKHQRCYTHEAGHYVHHGLRQSLYGGSSRGSLGYGEAAVALHQGGGGSMDRLLQDRRKQAIAHYVQRCRRGGDIDGQRSTSGMLVFLESAPISCLSLKQKVVALSMCEVEYVAAATAACQVVWLRRLLGELTGVEAHPPALRWTTSPSSPS